MANSGIQKCRLLLEGREVPFISAFLSSKPGMPVTGSVDLVPLSSIKNITPKTSVQIFVRDPMHFGDDDYYLAFDGEVIGRGMSRSSDARVFTVSVVDFNQYTDEAKTYFYNANYLRGMIAVQGQDFSTPGVDQQIKAAGVSRVVTASTVASQMIKTIIDPANKTIIAGVVSVIKSLVGLNSYYKIAFERNRIADRFVVKDSGSLSKFFKYVQSEEFLLKFNGANGGMASIRDVLNEIMGLVFHEFVSIPFPALLPLKTAAGKDTGSKRVGNFYFIPDTYSLPPPKCNVVFPNQIQQFQFQEDFRAAPSRMTYRYSFMTAAQPGQGGLISQQSMPTKYYPQSFSDFMYKSTISNPGPKPALLDASVIFLKGNYATINYGDTKSKALGPAVSPILREQDFLTNDESIRGIFPAVDTFPPAISQIASDLSEQERARVFNSIGEFLFFKKRFASRACNATLVFSPQLVPGFNMVLVDDSDSGQTVIGKLLAVNHQLSNQGCSTTAEIGYARDFEELDHLSGGTGEPPVPEWFDENLFGVRGTPGKQGPKFAEETAYLKKLGAISASEEKDRSTLTGYTAFTNLNSFYQELLGCNAMTDYGAGSGVNKSAIVTTRGAVTLLTYKYRNTSSNESNRDVFVRNYNSRPIPRMVEAMNFLGAVPRGGIVPEEFAFFQAGTTGPLAGRYDGKGFPEENVLKIRRSVIDKYVDQLKTKRGFRG